MMDCRGLGYLVIETPDRDEWERYLEGVVGLMPDSGPEGAEPNSSHFRMDDRIYRISVTTASQETYVAGWELPNEGAWRAAISALETAGVAVLTCDSSEAKLRGVSGLAKFVDPFDNAIEIFWGQFVTETPFESPQGVTAFCAGPLGVGHLLYVVPSCDQAVKFYRDLLGFQVTDYFVWGDKSAWFLRCNERHHTVAFVDLPIPGGFGLSHFMVEAQTLGDVGRALDRATDAKIEIINSLGQHSNDKCTSFYMRTPGRTNAEVGVGQLRIDDATWEVIAWSGRGDYWGHRGPLMDEIADAKV